MSSATPDWLGVARGAAAELRAVLASRPSIEQRARETGTRGEGGDRTLEIDAAAEQAVFRRLEALHAEGHAFSAISEERGRVDFGGGGTLVVIDPLDGSKNAKRGLPHHALSMAVADGPTMADVVLGFVHDFGPAEEWVAHRGGGAFLDGERLDPSVPERRTRGRLELVGVESADPRWIRDVADELAERAHRLRALGAMAVTLCQVAAARLDGLTTLQRCRAVDVAAAQLIVREGGGLVAFPGAPSPLGAPLDVMEPVYGLVAARSPEGLAELAAIPRV
ncbi:MAG TPA: inositol monophosphatase family protein [Solirubrobacteraceae bacterium]|nr:inositol monophosphatase family protein [Solirubrobacteraceae bacterium]